MSELRSALDALAADDLYALPAPVLLDRVRELTAAQNRIAAELARTVRRAELAQAPEHDGIKTMASWLRGHAHLSPAAANQVVRNGRALEQLPAVASRHADGQLTADQVALIAPITKPCHLGAAAAWRIDLAEVDATLADLAAASPHADLATVVHHYLARLHPDGPEPDPTEARSLSIAKHADGSITARLELDPLGAEKFQATVESFAQAHRPAGDTRSRAQRLADALVQACDNLLAAGDLPTLRGSKPQVFVTIPVADLLDPGVGPASATAGFGATLSAARARWAGCDAQITRITLDPDGRPLDLGRDVRLVPPHLRRAVEHRDKHCVFAGCDAPTWWCDVHHLIHWVFGGETSLENSGLLCERHHTQVHHGFDIHRDATGRWHTYRPDGTEILVPQPV